MNHGRSLESYSLIVFFAQDVLEIWILHHCSQVGFHNRCRVKHPKNEDKTLAVPNLGLEGIRPWNLVKTSSMANPESSSTIYSRQFRSIPMPMSWSHMTLLPLSWSSTEYTGSKLIIGQLWALCTADARATASLECDWNQLVCPNGFNYSGWETGSELITTIHGILNEHAFK